MDYLIAIGAGVVQGLTEFLPISSSGHLIIFHEFFNLDFGDDVLFDVVLHLGTFLALMIFFYQDVLKLIRGFFSSLINWNLENNFNQRLAWWIIIATIPAVVAGFFLEDIITIYLRSPLVVALMLIVFGGLLWLADTYFTKHRTVGQLAWWEAGIIGVAQVLAFVPGVSRSGITMIAGLSRKLNRSEAARFSFLLSIPTIGGAGLKKVLEVSDWSNLNLTLLVFGFIASLITAYLVIRFFLGYIARHSLAVFVWYRVIIGVLILIWLAVR